MAPAHQAGEDVLQVLAGEEVVGDSAEQIVGVERLEALRPIPLAVQEAHRVGSACARRGSALGSLSTCEAPRTGTTAGREGVPSGPAGATVARRTRVDKPVVRRERARRTRRTGSERRRASGTRRSRTSAPECRARLAALLIELPIEVQAVEDELDGRGDRRRIA